MACIFADSSNQSDRLGESCMIQRESIQIYLSPNALTTSMASLKVLEIAGSSTLLRISSILSVRKHKILWSPQRWLKVRYLNPAFILHVSHRRGSTSSPQPTSIRRAGYTFSLLDGEWHFEWDCRQSPCQRFISGHDSESLVELATVSQTRSLVSRQMSDKALGHLPLHQRQCFQRG